MTALLLPATRFHMDELALFMRDSDTDECRYLAQATGRAVPGWSIRKDLHDAFDTHQVWVMLRGNDVMGAGGIRPHPGTPGHGIVWFLGTDLADREWRTMTRLARRFLEIEAPAYERISNIVPAHGRKRLKWLAHLGFDIGVAEVQLSGMGYVPFWQYPCHGPEG